MNIRGLRSNPEKISSRKVKLAACVHSSRLQGETGLCLPTRGRLLSGHGRHLRGTTGVWRTPGTALGHMEGLGAHFP